MTYLDRDTTEEHLRHLAQILAIDWSIPQYIPARDDATDGPTKKRKAANNTLTLSLKGE